MAAISGSGGTFPVYDLSGFTLIGPDSAYAGTSGNGLRITGSAAPDSIVGDIYARGFFGAGKAGIWLGTSEGFSVHHIRGDLSDIGIKFSAAANAGSGDNLQSSQAHTTGILFDTVSGGAYSNLTVQGSNCNGVVFSAAADLAINGLYAENNQISGGSCAGVDFEPDSRAIQLNGLQAQSGQKVLMNGSSGHVVCYNTVTSAQARGVSQPFVTLNNIYSTGNTWNGFFVEDFSGTGNNGNEFGISLGEPVAITNGATSIAGTAGNWLYTQNSAPTAIANLPATALYSGQTISILVRDANTTFVTGGNIDLPGTLTPPAGRTTYTFRWWDVSGTWMRVQ